MRSRGRERQLEGERGETVRKRERQLEGERGERQ